MQSEQVRNAKAHASKQGLLKDKNVDELFSGIFESFHESGDTFNEKLKEHVKTELTDPEKMEYIEKEVNEDFKVNSDKYAGKFDLVQDILITLLLLRSELCLLV